MFGSSISSGIAADVSVAEGIAIEEITEVNSFTAGKKLFGEIRCLVTHFFLHHTGFDRKLIFGRTLPSLLRPSVTG
jgi:hypothetical protein